MHDAELEHRAREVLAAYGIGDVRLTPVAEGLINRTFFADAAGDRFVLQWVNPIFGPSVHDDIEAVTAHIARAGLVTPRLVRTRDGALCTRDSGGGLWRLLTYLDGTTYARAPSPAHCESAGRLVGRFHAAVSSLVHTFAHRRAHVHDTPRHLGHLADVLAARRDHPLCGEVEPIGREILARASSLPPLAGLPARIVHGDLKISNVLFSPAGEAVALVDLDTLAEMTIPVELGDAWRSWCNPKPEDDLAASFELGYFEAALRGYAEQGRALLTPAERAALPRSVETIALELAARFGADALEESYFGWDRQRFASASEHNLLRARGQLALSRSIATRRAAIEELVRTALG